MRSGRFARASRSVAACVAVAFATGCVDVARWECLAASPRPMHVRIVGAEREPARWLVILGTDPALTEQPDARGRVDLTIPALLGGRTFRWGVLTDDQGPLFTVVIHVEHDGRDVRTLSLAQLDELPKDAEGWRVLDPTE